MRLDWRRRLWWRLDGLAHAARDALWALCEWTNGHAWEAEGEARRRARARARGD